MIFRESMLREFRSTGWIIFATLLTIVVVVSLVRTLGRAAAGIADAELVLPLIVFSTIGSLPLILVLTGFLSVLLSLSRAWRDSELVVWFSSGLDLRKLYGIVFVFLFPIFLLCLAATNIVVPWSNSQSETLRDRFDSRPDILRANPGQFREGQTRDRIIFIEKNDPDSDGLGRVLMFSRSDLERREKVLVAEDGRFEIDKDGDTWVVLTNGSQTEFRIDHAAPDSVVGRMTFDGYTLRVEAAPASDPRVLSVRSLYTNDLLHQGDDVSLGEFSYRLGLPIFMMLFGLLAVPLSISPKRAQGAQGIMLGLLVGMVFNNLLVFTQAQIMRGRWDFELGWWPVHLLMLLLLILMASFKHGLKRSPSEWLWLAFRRSRLGV
jgi:lipopolysaccharide export system permease protein